LLLALRHELDGWLRLVGVDELLEQAAFHRIVDDFSPLAFVAVHEELHLLFQSVADAQTVVDDYFAQPFDAAVHFFKPNGSAHQPVGRLDVVHQKAIDVLDAGFGVEVGGEQVGMAWLGAAVAAHVEIPALLRGDDAEVLALRLGTFADTAGYRRLDLVRRTNALVTILDADGEADRILHAITTPRCTDATLHRAQCLAVSVAALEAGANQFLPDVRQQMHGGTEQIDALATGDFRVQAVFLRHLTENDELIGRDFAARHARYHGVGAAALEIG